MSFRQMHRQPGYPNPLVTLSVFDLGAYLSSPSRPSPSPSSLASNSTPTLDPRVAALTYKLVFSTPFAPEDQIISEVTWVGEGELMVRATDRTGGRERVAHFVVGEEEAMSGNGGEGTIVGKVVRDVDWVKEDGGWVEPVSFGLPASTARPGADVSCWAQGQTMVGIASTVLLHSKHTTTSAAAKPDYPPGYLDIVPSPEGFSHLAYFSPPESKEPVFLTSGRWEIDGGVESVDVERGLVYVVCEVEACRSAAAHSAFCGPQILYRSQSFNSATPLLGPPPHQRHFRLPGKRRSNPRETDPPHGRQGECGWVSSDELLTFCGVLRVEL